MSVCPFVCLSQRATAAPAAGRFAAEVGCGPAADNVPVHTSGVAMSVATECGYESLTRPPYLLDLAPLDLSVPITERTLAWHTIFKLQWRHCVRGGLSSGAKIARRTLL